MQKCNHNWMHPYSVLLGQFVPYAYKCKLCGELVISDNGPIPEIEQKINIERTTMSHHNYTPPVTPKPSKAQDVIVTISCLAVFAFWGVLLALGV